jgi:hypothetical protein
MTMLAAAPQTISRAIPVVSPDDLLKMESSGLFELTDGRLLEKQMGYDSNWTAGQIAARLNVHLWQTKARGITSRVSQGTSAADRVRN